MNKIANKFRWLVWFMCGLCTACTVYDTPADIAGGSSEVSQKDDGVVRYVLWVNIDGARGTVVKEEVEKGNLPVLKQMLAHSKYAWVGLADGHDWLPDNRGSFSEEDPVTWASMLTGVNSRMHRIKDYSYTPDYVMGASPVIPNTVVQYLSNNDPMLRMSCVTPWENLNHFVGMMQSVVTTASDEQTVETLEKQLSGGDYRFTLAAFKGVQDAGLQGGFKASNAQYVDGLKQVDTYLGRLLEVIGARKDAANEDWLVCVTSDHGGTDDGRYGGSSEAERDIFGIFYYDHYTPFEMKGESFYAARFSATEWATAEDTTAFYGIGADQQLFVEMNIRNTPSEKQSYNGPNWTYLMGKKGWGMFRKGDDVRFRTAVNGTIEEAVKGCNDARWHSWYMGLGATTTGGRTYQISYDGRVQRSGLTSAMGLKEDSSALVMGKGSWPNYDGNASSSLSPYYVASLRLWYALLPDVNVEELACMLEVPSDYPLRDHLIGEWRFSPAESTADSNIPNRAVGWPEVVFITDFDYVKVPNTLPDKLASGHLMMENTLVVPQIIYWLCGADAIDSKLDGYNFLSAYKTEEQWRDQ